MRALFLADAVFADKPGGSQVVARELAREMVARGHEITFLVARHNEQAPDDECHDGIRIVRYRGAGKAGDFVRQGRQACSRLWHETPFDIVHTHFAYSAVGPLQAIPASTPHLRSFYGPWDVEGWVEDCAFMAKMQAQGEHLPRHLLRSAKARMKRVLRHQAEVANLRRSREIIVLSDHSRDEVLELGAPAKRIHKIHPGVDARRFHPVPDRRPVRQQLGLPLDAPILFSARRLTPRMGLDNLIRAMPRVIAHLPDAQLIIGGQGPERDKLQAIIAQCALENHVRLAGFIPDELLAAHYQAADLFVLPTISLEGFGLVTVEALACGTPVLGTPIGATPSILNEIDVRLLTRSASAEHLAEGIIKFFAEKMASALTPQLLSDHVAGRFCWQRHALAIESLYQGLLEPGAVAAAADPAVADALDAGETDAQLKEATAKSRWRPRIIL